MRRISAVQALLALSTVAASAVDNPAPFTCAILPDGKSVRASVTNPFDRETSCSVNCQFSTPQQGSSFQVSCTKTIEAGSKSIDLCVRESSRALVKMTGGNADCVRPLAEEETDEDSDALIEKLQKQGQDFIDRTKKK
jgi:hypothetical protein